MSVHLPHQESNYKKNEESQCWRDCGEARALCTAGGRSAPRWSVLCVQDVRALSGQHGGSPEIQTERPPCPEVPLQGISPQQAKSDLLDTPALPGPLQLYSHQPGRTSHLRVASGGRVKMSHTRMEADAPHHETARVDPEESRVCYHLQRDPRGQAHGGRAGLLGSLDTGHAQQQAQRLGLQGHVSWGSMPRWAGGSSMANRPNVVNGAELVLCFHHNKRKEKCVDRQSVLQGPVWVQRKGRGRGALLGRSGSYTLTS